MRRRFSKWFLPVPVWPLVVGSSVFGMQLKAGPQAAAGMAQASIVEHCTHNGMQMPPPAATLPASDDKDPPCCTVGSCQCGYPPSLPFVAMTTAPVRPSEAPAMTTVIQPPAEPQSTLLRPPIA